MEPQRSSRRCSVSGLTSVSWCPTISPTSGEPERPRPPDPVSCPPPPGWRFRLWSPHSTSPPAAVQLCRLSIWAVWTGKPSTSGLQKQAQLAGDKVCECKRNETSARRRGSRVLYARTSTRVSPTTRTHTSRPQTASSHSSSAGSR